MALIKRQSIADHEIDTSDIQIYLSLSCFPTDSVERDIYIGKRHISWKYWSETELYDFTL